MEKFFRDLLDISHEVGGNKQFVVAGGGNVSLKNEKYLYIKGSGYALATIKLEEFAKLERVKIDELLADTYDNEPQKRESQVKDRILACRADPNNKVRPSVETPFHHLLNYRFVVHTHPYLVNSVFCSQQNRENWEKLFKKESFFVSYVDPGYILAKTIELELNQYRKMNKSEPNCIFLENHGVIVGADSIEEIRKIYCDLFKIIKSKIPSEFKIENYQIPDPNNPYISTLKQVMQKENVFVHGINNSLIQYFLHDSIKYNDIKLPFNPDTVVYCKGSPLIIDFEITIADFKGKLHHTLDEYIQEWGYLPKIVLIKNVGMFGLSDSQKSAENAVEMFQDSLLIAYYSQYFGGPKAMTRRDIHFIDNWEVEQFRRSIAK
jgi:rhamnose utilization protein RhaD (predicted bifunctional aldolase and dehydrogenase)